MWRCSLRTPSTEGRSSGSGRWEISLQAQILRWRYEISAQKSEEDPESQEKKTKGTKNWAIYSFFPKILICNHMCYLGKGPPVPVGKTQARNPTDKPEVGRNLLRKGDLGPATAGARPQ